jgi:3-deoxy-D-manno-octulosonate 8-phosphate phosphatase (KDO 8-P phosphatase)
MKKRLTKSQLLKKASKIKLVIADVDGVLTDTGVYYSANGEELKRYSIRDGMGIERLRKLVDVETGIMTRENTKLVSSRAEKLRITELHMGVMEKAKALEEILVRKNLNANEVAYIGDDIIDVEVMRLVGLSAAPLDATKFAKEAAGYITESKAGYGAFRDFAELIIEAKMKKRNNQHG